MWRRHRKTKLSFEHFISMSCLFSSQCVGILKLIWSHNVQTEKSDKLGFPLSFTNSDKTSINQIHLVPSTHGSLSNLCVMAPRSCTCLGQRGSLWIWSFSSLYLGKMVHNVREDQSEGAQMSRQRQTLQRFLGVYEDHLPSFLLQVNGHLLS